MELDDWNSPTTKLLTLLNVSALKSSKRKFIDQQDSSSQKLNKRRVLDLDHSSPNAAVQENADAEITEPEVEAGKDDPPCFVGVSEADNLSDTEGVLHPWSTKRSSDWAARKSIRLRTSCTLELHRHFSINLQSNL